VKLPNDINKRNSGKQCERPELENNLEDLKATSTRQVILQSGLTVPVYIHSGAKDSGSGGLSVIAVVAAYENVDSSTLSQG
jgi:hypothetical protein